MASSSQGATSFTFCIPEQRALSTLRPTVWALGTLNPMRTLGALRYRIATHTTHLRFTRLPSVLTYYAPSHRSSTFHALDSKWLDLSSTNCAFHSPEY